MKSSWHWLCTLALALLQGAAAADSAMPAGTRLGGDLFSAGRAVSLGEAVAGDLFAAGGTVEVGAAVSGDAVLGGGQLRVAGEVGHSIYAAGGQVNVQGRIGRNLRAVGGDIVLAPKAEVLGNVSVAGGDVQLRGAVRGHVQVGAGRVLIDGPVGGDVQAAAGHLELGPNARIAGQLRWRSRNEIQQDPAAQIQGGAVRIGLPATAGPDRERRATRSAAARAGFALAWTAGLVLTAAALLAALPGFCEGLAGTLRERIVMSLLLGFVVLVCTPVAALLLFLTLIGIPLGLLALLAYPAALLLAYVGAGIGLGDWGLRRFRPQDLARTGWRITAAGAALFVMTLLGAIPWLGGLFVFLVLLAGLGALTLHIAARWRGRSPAASGTARA